MINLLSLGAPHAGGGAAVGVQQPSRDRTTFECFQASLPLHMSCMVLGSSLPDRNSKKETVTDYISVVTAVGQPPTANRTPSAVTANPELSTQDIVFVLNSQNASVDYVPTPSKRPTEALPVLLCEDSHATRTGFNEQSSTGLGSSRLVMSPAALHLLHAGCQGCNPQATADWYTNIRKTSG